ncbi:MAG: DNA polymerase III subunit beta [Deltaproteobacteria bacterium RBG_13_47_9]|nr:MAG: DNA polymerase III subunit beta [Deltaproteobacteria bacterium RBG_13_47_9]
MEKREFLKGLSLIQGIAGRKTTLPILTHVLLESKKESVQLTGTDLEIGIREELSGKVYQEGSASVSAKKIYEIVRELPDETIHIQKKENQWIRIQCGKSIFNLSGLDPEEFPALPTYSEDYFSQLPISLLSEMIEKTVFAASNEESRYHLNGVLFLQIKEGGKERLRMVATDGHRLSLIDRETHLVRGVEKGIIIPKKGVLELKRVVSDKEEGEVGIYFDPTHGFLKIGKSLIVIRLIDGEFPEYEQVIPKENDKRITVDKEKLYGCLRRVSTMTSERGEGIKLSIKGHSIELSTFNQDFGDAREEVDVNYEGSSFEIGFNSRYLLEALNVMDTTEIVIELKDEGSPGIIKPLSSTETTDQLCIIMPMRI